MKKIFFSFILLLALGLGLIFFIALPKTKKDIEAQLHALGFQNIEIGELSIHASGFRISNIGFDKDGFNNIINLKADVFWPAYLLETNINSIVIEEIKHSSVSSEFQNILSHKEIFNFKKISTLPIDKVKIEKITSDIMTSEGAIRLESTLKIKNEKQKKTIAASVTARQDQLTFNSQWSGVIADNTVELDGTFDEFRLNYGPLNINRGSGWLSYQEKDSKSNLSGQLDAGNGRIFNIPTHNISLLLGQETDYYPILFRAQASGIEDVLLTIDIHASKHTEKQAFNSALKINNLNHFLSYLQKQKLLKGELDNSIDANQKTEMFVNYLPDKRFADGPIPFDFKIKQNLEEKLQGTFLIYPDSFDIRGTAETDSSTIEFIQSLGVLKEENISEETIRLDGNVKSLLTTR